MLEIRKGDYVRITGKARYKGQEVDLLPVGTICLVERVFPDGDLEVSPQFCNDKTFRSGTYVYPVTSVEKGMMLWHPAVEADEEMEKEELEPYYVVTVVETLRKEVKVRAASPEDATSKAEAAWSLSKIVLTSDDFDHVEYFAAICPEKEACFIAELEGEVCADEC